MVYILVIISSGLFLGWLLGANDTVNLFGSSVRNEMLNIKSAALIASIFIILGAVFQGKGTTSTIHHIGYISEATSAFIVALSAALIVLFLTRIKLPVSTSQAIVGGIAGWSIFAKAASDFNVFYPIVFAWLLAPLVSILISILLYIGLRNLIRKTKIHLIHLDTYLKTGLVIGIALSAYGLGANNIGNVIGVFTDFSPEIILNFGFFNIDGLQILFLFGAISIAAGIYTYSLKAQEGKGYSNLSLMPEAAIVVLFSQAIVLFLFSSTWFSGILSAVGLPSLPLVPVSSTQIVVGSVLGIGIVKGAREIDNKTLGGIGLGWIAAPLGAGIISYFFLFIAQHIFGFAIRHQDFRKVIFPETSTDPGHSSYINMIWPGIGILITLTLLFFLYLLFRQQQLRLKAEKDILLQQNQLYQSQKAMNELEMHTIAMENETLNFKLQAKRKEFMDIALNINDQRIFLEKISNAINEIIKLTNESERNEKLKEVSLLIKQKMTFSQEKKEFYLQIEEIHKDFHMKLKTSFPNLTDLEKRLAGLIRLNLSTKEISSLLNISQKSVEVSRYRLKKKMNLEKEKTLIEFINNL